MLSRVASELYWLARHLERAENIARILDVSQSVSLMHSGTAQAISEPLAITRSEADFAAWLQTRNPTVTPHIDSVASFLVWENNHPSSIVRCLENSRDNARAVRGAITSEMWECINDTWIELQNRKKRCCISNQEGGLDIVDPDFFDWVKERAQLCYGISLSTLRRGQPFLFMQLGTYIERADNTASILAVKYGAANAQFGAQAADYYRLGAILRSVSAREAYSDIYRDVFTPERVAELLIFEATQPRSLRYCLAETVAILKQLPDNRGKAARKYAGLLNASLEHGDLQDVWREGLTPYLFRFMADNARLATAVHEAYLELN